jgi:hypothetical protein
MLALNRQMHAKRPSNPQNIDTYREAVLTL